MTEEFKKEVLKWRYKFNDLEKTLSKRPSSIPPQTERRALYKKFMNENNVNQEIIDYSLNEFLPKHKRIK